MYAKAENKWLVAASVTTGAVMAAVDTSILNIATPHLRGVFSATTAEISWISTGYLLAVVIGMPLTGWLCSQFDRKNVCLGGLAVFIFASILCGFATELGLLVAARILQGLGAGVLLPVEQVILRQAFPPKEHGLAMGLYGVTVMIGPTIAPLLGGLIIDNYHWSLIFFVNVPVGLAGVFMVHRFVQNKPAQGDPVVSIKPDWIGILLLAMALFFLLWLLERGERLDWFETQSNVWLLVVSISSFTLFCAHELITKKPAVDLRILNNRAFSSAVFMSFVLGFVVSATLFVLPIYMQDVLGFSATHAGEALVPRALVMMIAFPLIGRLYNHVSTKLLMAIGLALGFFSAILMSKFTKVTGIHDIILPQILQGVAVSCILTPLSTVALLHVAADRLAAAAGLNAFSRQLGSSIGIAICSSLISHFELVVRGALIHHINWANPVLRDRFTGVIRYFYTKSINDYTTAMHQGFSQLNSNVTKQVVVISYQKTFEWLAVAFIVMFICLFFMKTKRHEYI
ncbi:MDR family MFS transporter [Methylobacter tundripaludum]|uniref:MDR family MFS transporter n=1 Tax=Methylobacter tundripaludum TaxID=173365 RepID=UPI0004844B90|nr:MDR family MFS transporter [Methylobacter tundripaludum]